MELADPNKKIKVYVRGYILSGPGDGGDKEFELSHERPVPFRLPDSYRPTDLIHIESMGDRTMNFTPHEIGVGGIS